MSDDYVTESLIPLPYEQHGGEDVGIYARGPMSHLFHGVLEQNVIAHIMAYASCVGVYQDCAWMQEPKEGNKPPALQTNNGCVTVGSLYGLMIVMILPYLSNYE